MTTQTLSIPRATHGLIMAAATLAAIGGAWAWSRSMGGSAVALDVAIALAIGSLATFLPAMLRIGPDYWGVAVLFCGTARALLVLGACYMFAKNTPDLPERPMYLPAVGAAVFLLAVESAVAIRILSGLERQKTALRGAAVGGH